MKKLIYKNGFYKMSEHASYKFTIFTKDETCGRGEYSEEIDVMCLRRSIGEAKRIAQAALDQDYVEGLRISRVEFMF